MIRNPVCSRELKVSSRSFRLPLIILLFNGILSLVTLLNMYSVVEQVKKTAVIQYSSFMDMYRFVTTIEFILLLFIVPAVTAASISGERERQTLDLMLTTQMTAVQVVIGKLMSALGTMLLLIVSSFPAVAMVFVYGGITWGDVFSLLLCYLAAAFFAGSLGICCSAVFKRSTMSTVITYGIMIAVVAGTYFMNKFCLALSSTRISNTAAVFGTEAGLKASSGGMFYLLLLNPAATFLAIISRQAEGSKAVAELGGYFGMNVSGFVMDNWVIISIMLQAALACVMIAAAVWCVEPVKGRARQYKNRNKRGESSDTAEADGDIKALRKN